MSVSAVALFGSRARGNAAPHSDVDILLITSERKTRHVVMGNISMFLYPWRELQHRAVTGDLFVCHIVEESRPLYDPKRRLDALKQSFKLKRSYADEIAQATDLGWFIVLHHTTMPGRLVTKRLAWCVRTILIASAAEQGTPLFGAADLAAFSGSDAVRRLIKRKDDRAPTKRSLDTFRAFLEQHGSSGLDPGRDLAGFRALFRNRKNRVALQTLRLSEASAIYSDL